MINKFVKINKLQKIKTYNTKKESENKILTKFILQKNFKIKSFYFKFLYKIFHNILINEKKAQENLFMKRIQKIILM